MSEACSTTPKSMSSSVSFYSNHSFASGYLATTNLFSVHTDKVLQTYFSHPYVTLEPEVFAERPYSPPTDDSVALNYNQAQLNICHQSPAVNILDDISEKHSSLTPRLSPMKKETEIYCRSGVTQTARGTRSSKSWPSELVLSKKKLLEERKENGQEGKYQTRKARGKMLQLQMDSPQQQNSPKNYCNPTQEIAETDERNDNVLKAFHRAQFFKTRMCPHFLKNGKCRKSNDCNYAHDKEELKPTKTKICHEYMAGRCDKMINECLFAHGLQELRATTGFYKTQMCKFWLSGYCPAGTLCRHAHGGSECPSELATTGNLIVNTDNDASRRSVKNPIHTLSSGSTLDEQYPFNESNRYLMRCPLSRSLPSRNMKLSKSQMDQARCCSRSETFGSFKKISYPSLNKHKQHEFHTSSHMTIMGLQQTTSSSETRQETHALDSKDSVQQQQHTGNLQLLTSLSMTHVPQNDKCHPSLLPNVYTVPPPLHFKKQSDKYINNHVYFDNDTTCQHLGHYSTELFDHIPDYQHDQPISHRFPHDSLHHQLIRPTLPSSDFNISSHYGIPPSESVSHIHIPINSTNTLQDMTTYTCVTPLIRPNIPETLSSIHKTPDLESFISLRSMSSPSSVLSDASHPLSVCSPLCQSGSMNDTLTDISSLHTCIPQQLSTVDDVLHQLNQSIHIIHPYSVPIIESMMEHQCKTTESLHSDFVIPQQCQTAAAQYTIETAPPMGIISHTPCLPYSMESSLILSPSSSASSYLIKQLSSESPLFVHSDDIKTSTELKTDILHIPRVQSLQQEHPMHSQSLMTTTHLSCLNNQIIERHHNEDVYPIIELPSQLLTLSNASFKTMYQTEDHLLDKNKHIDIPNPDGTQHLYSTFKYKAYHPKAYSLNPGVQTKTSHSLPPVKDSIQTLVQQKPQDEHVISYYPLNLPSVSVEARKKRCYVVQSYKANNWSSHQIDTILPVDNHDKKSGDCYHSVCKINKLCRLRTIAAYARLQRYHEDSKSKTS